MIDVGHKSFEKVEEILLQLDSSLKDVAGAERRVAARLNVRMALSGIVLGGGAPQRISLYSRNISTSGLGFVARHPFDPGETLVLILRIGGHPAKWVWAQIIFCRYADQGFHEMGAKFLEAIPEDPRNPERIPAKWKITAKIK